MTPSEYQRLAIRTECDNLAAINRLSGVSLPPPDSLTQPARLVHAALGVTSEAGEFATAVKRWLYYGKAIDKVNMREELGDILWFAALACTAIGASLEDVMAANIAKLRQRYPEKYTDALAAEEGRDREAERRVMEAMRGDPVDEQLSRAIAAYVERGILGDDVEIDREKLREEFEKWNATGPRLMTYEELKQYQRAKALARGFHDWVGNVCIQCGITAEQHIARDHPPCPKNPNGDTYLDASKASGG